MTKAVGILCSVYDPVRDLAMELSELVASCGGSATRMLVEDLSGRPSTESYPHILFVLSAHPDVWNMAYWFAQLGLRVINGGFFLQGGDRIAVQIRMKDAGLSILPFAFAAHPAVFKDTELWNTYPAILKSMTKEIEWPVVNNLGELHDWVETTRPHRFGWMIQQFVQTDVTTKLYFVGGHFHAVDKRGRNDQRACLNSKSDVVALGERIARVLSLEVGSIDMVRDQGGKLWPVDVNSVPAFRLWPSGYQLLAEHLMKQAGNEST
jgi:hypothetical protein